jgi:hypothetical protein
LFATSIVDTSGKFAASIVGTGANLQQVLTTPAELLANLPPVSLIPVVHLDLQISSRIFKKNSK